MTTRARALVGTSRWFSVRPWSRRWGCTCVPNDAGWARAPGHIGARGLAADNSDASPSTHLGNQARPRGTSEGSPVPETPGDKGRPRQDSNLRKLGSVVVPMLGASVGALGRTRTCAHGSGGRWIERCSRRSERILEPTRGVPSPGLPWRARCATALHRRDRYQQEEFEEGNNVGASDAGDQDQRDPRPPVDEAGQTAVDCAAHDRWPRAQQVVPHSRRGRSLSRLAVAGSAGGRAVRFGVRRAVCVAGVDAGLAGPSVGAALGVGAVARVAASYPCLSA